MYIRKTPGCTVDVLIEALELHFRRSIKKTIIGVRPGEKIHETLITADELSRNLEEPEAFGTEMITAIRSYFECKMVPDAVVYDKFDEEIPPPGGDFTSNDTELLDAEATLALVKEAGIL
jgi:UDP-glucose 4-epimerase